MNGLNESVLKDKTKIKKSFFNKSSYPLFDYFNKNLKLADFVRKYNNKSNMVKISKPTNQDLNQIYIELHKNTEDSKKINCYACGYGKCINMAKAYT